jgi:hypothetical protein
MQHVRRHTLFLDSDKASLLSDTPWAWTVALEPGLLQCMPGEHMRLTLEAFYTVHDWGWIPPGAAVTLTQPAPHADVTVLLPEGNPTLATLAYSIAAQVAGHGGVPGFACSWNPATNRMEFECDRDGWGLRFHDLDAAALLDFDSVIVDTDTQFIQSARSLTPLPVQTIRIDVLGVRPAVNGHNITNVGPAAQAQPCTTLAVLPMTAKP